MSSVKIFSGSGSIELAKKIASEFGKPLGKGKLGKFSDGELSFRYTETVRGGVRVSWRPSLTERRRPRQEERETTVLWLRLP